MCPNVEKLSYTTTDRKGYRYYKSDPKKCVSCPFLESCTRSKNHQKVISRHVWEEQIEKIRQNRLYISGKKLKREKKK
ncbi:transposase [Bacillus safensis]|nr:transposase [Bacillus safensis]